MLALGGVIVNIETTAALVLFLEVSPGRFLSDVPSLLGQFVEVITISESSSTASDLKDDKNSKTADEDDEHGPVEGEVAEGADDGDDSNEQAKAESEDDNFLKASDGEAGEDVSVSESDDGGKEQSGAEDEEDGETNAHDDLGHVGPSVNAISDFTARHRSAHC